MGAVCILCSSQENCRILQCLLMSANQKYVLIESLKSFFMLLYKYITLALGGPSALFGENQRPGTSGLGPQRDAKPVFLQNSN